MADKSGDQKTSLRKIGFKIAKATIKAIIVYVVYLFGSSLLAPLYQFVPGLQFAIGTFVTVYVVLMILGDVTSGTIYQHFFNVAQALFVIGYLMASVKNGVFGATYENVNLMVDLRLFMVVAMLLGLLGLAKSVLQAIDYMSQKAEIPLI